jgi:hypothetical protein
MKCTSREGEASSTFSSSFTFFADLFGTDLGLAGLALPWFYLSIQLVSTLT